jgi:hypothetical protein
MKKAQPITRSISSDNGCWSLDIKPKMFRYPTHLQQGKWYLFSELKKKFNFVKIC